MIVNVKLTLKILLFRGPNFRRKNLHFFFGLLSIVELCKIGTRGGGVVNFLTISLRQQKLLKFNNDRKWAT